MSLNLGLSLIQGMKQELRMTPQLQMAIRHLQLSRQEMIEEIQKELMGNPLLEDQSAYAASSDSADREPKNGDLEDRGRRERKRERDLEGLHDDKPRLEGGSSDRLNSIADLNTIEGSHQARQEMDWERYASDDSYGRREIDQLRVSNDEYISPEMTYSRSETLSEHLTEQVMLSDFSDSEREIATLLIGNINDQGYLEGVSAAEIAIELDVDLELVEEVIESIQMFDPVGVCARDLKECLIAQCKALELNQELQILISEHLEDIERNRLPQISKQMNISLSRVADLVEELRQLDPKPGRQYSSESITYVTPDVYVDWVDDELKVRVNETGFPRLTINRFYREQLLKKSDGRRARVKEDEGKRYVTERLNAAQWFIKSLEQRKQTIVRVMEEILQVQYDFFLKGPEHLKPLVLRQIAENLELHESTISRVTSNKYVYTPRGLFELKYFFNSSIQGSDGNEALAGEAVKNKIKRLIEGEDPYKPLSDQKIVQLLEDDGISIARRTVAKYRESLGIGSSSQRRAHI